MLIYLVLILVIILILVSYQSEPFTLPRVAILLGTCVKPNAPKYRDNIRHRLAMYLERIDKWQKENIDIIVVESSNSAEIVNHNNVKYNIIDLSGKKGNRTQLEALSILDTYNKGYFNDYDLIIKVTGKYFIPGFIDILNNLPKDIDIVYQHRQKTGGQNSEIFGFRPSLCEKIFTPVTIPGSKMMEAHLRDIHQRLNIKAYRLPLLKPSHNAPRGDGSVLNTL